MAARQIVPDQSLLNQGIAPNYGQIQWEADREEQARIEAEQRRQQYNTFLTDSIAQAPGWGGSYAASIGLNPNDPGIASIIQQITNNIGSATPRDQDTTINPQSYFSPDAWQQGFNDFESRGRRANVAQVRNAFAPGFENTLMPDSDIDAIVNSILGEQRGLADTKLGYQSKRGLLTPQGTEQANKSLANQSEAGKSTLSSLARGALDKDRSSLLDIVSNAGNAASSWMLGNDAFSVDPYRTQVNERAAREREGFGGDVRAALGNTQLFDIPQIVAQAGTAQGADNLNLGTDPTRVAANRRKNDTGRGLGSTGGGF